MWIDLLWVVIGIVLLTFGGEVLIKGALGAAKRLNVSPLLSGLVIVGFGTSSPELAVSVDAALNQSPDIAVGNVVGSNIGNILLILGLCAIIMPMRVQPLALRRDGLTMLAATILVIALIGGVALARLDALIMLLALAAYLIWAYLTERQHQQPAAVAAAELHQAEADEIQHYPAQTWKIASYIVVGLVLLIAGSRGLLIGAVSLAQSFGVSEALIGLTLVAVGTSLPELTVSVMAAIRKHADVAVGNILGSNIFNILGILGVSALLQPLPVAPRMLQFDLWVMLASAVLLLVFLFTGRRLSRIEGGLLAAGYVAYVYTSFVMFPG